MTTGGWWRISAVALALSTAGLWAPASARDQRPPSAPDPRTPGTLRGVEGLARAYDAIMDARFDDVAADLLLACGPAPKEACDVLAATSLWWRIQLDPGSTALDAAFSNAVERAIASAEAWVDRAPRDAEAWFYLGGAYAARVQWRVLRGEKLAAARDGGRIHQALTRAVALDPALDDAYFALGMYKYYADVAPAAARVLRFLLLLPGGDRDEGLAEMLRARDRGQLLQGEADYQLHVIYLWYEEEVDGALSLLSGLQKEYPGNPHFTAQIADIQDRYQHDVTASLATWRALLAAGREQRVNAPALAQAQARLGIALQLERLHQTDHAIEQLEALVAMRPDAPYAALALAHLRLGEARDRLGQREQAVAAYRAAIAAAPRPDPHDVRAQASLRLRRRPDPRRAEAYRLSLEGFRRLEGNAPAAAALALEQSLELNPDDPVARSRYARVLQSRGDDEDALAEYERAIARAADGPPALLGTTYLDAARLHERAGRLPQALSYYQIAASLFGASADTHAAARRALTRLRAR
jgi:tetratricopeptide (TPR) repeat protein